MAEFGLPSTGWAGATKTAILNIISFSNLRICCFAQSSTRPEARWPRRMTGSAVPAMDVVFWTGGIIK